MAWYRQLASADASYGFVDESTPELAVGVRPRYGGNGIREALLEVLCDRAKADGRKRLSLSVEQANPACRLYARLGFRTVAEAGGSWTIVRTRVW
jgi:GNAT superfamily N-acetyltransferase